MSLLLYNSLSLSHSHINVNTIWAKRASLSGYLSNFSLSAHSTLIMPAHGRCLFGLESVFRTQKQGRPPQHHPSTYRTGQPALKQPLSVHDGIWNPMHFLKHLMIQTKTSFGPPLRCWCTMGVHEPLVSSFE